MIQHIIALIDCDSFYVSCERKDNPSLQEKPVCVMTGGGNKGIIVSRSKEAKALGIKMGAPFFQVKDKFPQAIYIPARMNRYNEISNEVMNTIKTFSPDVEVTSVD
jgi:nucleotidyltransferase/DNA polymerase involved in DNA repair